MTREPHATPGESFVYSNAGYTIAGAMAEQVTGKPWCDLVKERLFDPLGMDADFGWPALSDPHQPWGHRYEEAKDVPVDQHMAITSGTLLPHPPTDAYQLGPENAASGDVHVSIDGFVRFLQLHLKGHCGTDTILKSDTVRFMHEALVDGYALGWVVVSTDTDEGNVLWHNGSACTFCSQTIMLPERDFGLVVMCNAGHASAWNGCGKLCQALFDTMRQT